MIGRDHGLPLRRPAAVLRLSRSALCHKAHPMPAGELAVMRRIDELHLGSPFVGSRMRRDLLRDEGIAIGRKRVAAMMRRMGIEALYRRPNTSKLVAGASSLPVCDVQSKACDRTVASDDRRNSLREGVAVQPRKRRSDRAGRNALPSRGRPSVARCRRWSGHDGSGRRAACRQRRWRHDRSRCPSALCFANREEIGVLRAPGHGAGRSPAACGSTSPKMRRRASATRPFIALRRELTACLRTVRALRAQPRTGRALCRPGSHDQPAPGGGGSPGGAGPLGGGSHSRLGQLRGWHLGEAHDASETACDLRGLTMLLHLTRMPSHGCGARVKNGAALARHGAEAVSGAVARTITPLPEQLRRPLAWDQGAEMSQHAQLRINTGMGIYFCDPHSPWPRGTNENTNGLLRQCCPKGAGLSVHSTDDPAAVAMALNARPARPLAGEHPPRPLARACERLTQAVATTG